MRHSFLGRWICLPVSGRFRLVWRCRLFDHSTYIPFCVRWHGGQCPWRLVPNHAVVFDRLTEYVILWIGFSETILILCLNFFSFWFNMTELQSTINLSRYGNKGYATVVLGNSKRMQPFVCLYCGQVIYSIAVLEQKVIEFPYFLYLWWYFIKTGSFPVFICIMLSSSWVNCPSWLLTVFVIGLSVTLRDFSNRFLEYSFHMCIRSSWVTPFTFTLEVLFTHFIYCLPCYSRLSIFYQIFILLIWPWMYLIVLFDMH